MFARVNNYTQYEGGYFAFKRILRYRDDGTKVISRMATGWKHFADDYVSSAYLNANGLRVAYCIPLDIDAKDTDKKWLDSAGAIDWEMALAFLQKTYPEIFQYTLFIVRSTGGKGIHIGLAISPIVKDGTTGTDKTLFLAKQAQIQIMRLLNRHGLGADYSATGVVRDLPNWRRRKESKHSKAKQLYFNQTIRARIKREKLPVLSELLTITNALKECQPQAKKDQSEVLHTNKTTESRLAPLYIDLFDNLGQSQCYTMSELKELTGISKDTLRNILVRRPQSRPKWLNVNYISKTEGYELWINPEHGCIERALKLVAAPVCKSNFTHNLKCPTEVEDGERNAWVSSAAIHYKWHGFSKHETMIELNRQCKLIPEYQQSASFQNIPQIVGSVFSNLPELHGIRQDFELPAVLSAGYFHKLKKLQKAPQGVTGCSLSVAFTRKENQKYAVGYHQGKVLAQSKVEGNGYVFQLRAIQSLLSQLEQNPSEVVICGRSMLQENPVADKFALFHRFKLRFRERESEDKALLKEFRGEEKPRKSRPVEAFRIPEMVQKKVRCDGFVNVSDRYYWLGESWISKKIQVVITDQIELYFKAQIVASYQPLPEKNSSTPGSYEPWVKAQESTSHYRRKARKVGPAFDNLVLEQIKRGEGLIDTAKVMGYLGLLKHWPYEQLEAVAIHCLKRRNFNFRYFKSCLEVGHE